jgi:gliding motility-associated protein GldM
MAGYKETPRQKMIGMMYLVLTALLALNVSKDILNAFVIVNGGLVTSQENTTSKNELIYSNFEKSLKENPIKVKPYYDNAIKAQKYADELVKYVSDLRTQIIAFTEFGIKDKSSDAASWGIADTMQLSSVGAKDNYDKPMEILIGQSEDGSAGSGAVLKTKLEDFKKKMLDLIYDLKNAEAEKITDASKKSITLQNIKKERETSEKNFPIDTKDAFSYTEGKVENWIVRNFYHTVLVADVSLLNKFIVDVKTVEGDVIAKLYSSVDASSFKFDKIVGRVVSESNYILLGSEYKANIFLAAYDSKKSPDIYIGDTTTHVGELLDKTKFEDGMGVYTRSGSGIGEQKYTGWISLVKPGETTPTYYNFASSFMVGQPSATVSADKMNVFYIGIANPVTISVPGVANTAVHASISAGGTLTSTGAGKYSVMVTSASKTVTVSVMADMAGKMTSMGTSTFRVKRVPDPVPTIGNSTGGVISKSLLAAAGGIIPVMKDFDFEGANFVITSFTMTMNVKGDLIEKNAVGNKLTTEMVTMIKAAANGTKVYLENIKAKGPDGSPRGLASINLKLSN